jgi:hypothetical protein
MLILKKGITRQDQKEHEHQVASALLSPGIGLLMSGLPVKKQGTRRRVPCHERPQDVV